MTWQDCDDLTPINGWCTFRGVSLDAEGATSFVVMHLVNQDNGEVYAMCLSVDTATRLGYDLLGDALGITDLVDDDDDD